MTDFQMRSVEERIQWHRHRAQEVRKVAEGIVDDECRRALELLADRYERVAAVLEGNSENADPR